MTDHDFWAHMCTLHGGLICAAFCLFQLKLSVSPPYYPWVTATYIMIFHDLSWNAMNLTSIYTGMYWWIIWILVRHLILLHSKICEVWLNLAKFWYAWPTYLTHILKMHIDLWPNYLTYILQRDARLSVTIMEHVSCFSTAGNVPFWPLT